MKKFSSLKLSSWGAILLLIALIAPLQKAYATPRTKSDDLSKFSPAQVTLATAHWTEGIEHPLIRQLVANPDICKNTKDCKSFSGDRSDARAVKQWAGQQAGVLAFKAGYVDQFGAEVRVKEGNKMAYIIQKNAGGDIQIVEGTVTTPPSATATTPDSGGTFQLSSIAGSHTVVASVAAAQFIGASPKTGDVVPVPVYEYVYLG
jgi:hypothetical protein